MTSALVNTNTVNELVPKSLGATLMHKGQATEAKKRKLPESTIVMDEVG